MHQGKGLESKYKGEVFYISPYLPQEKKYERHFSPAAQTKVGYVRTKLQKYVTTTVCINCSLTVDNSVILPKQFKDDYGSIRILGSVSSTKRLFLPICGAVMLFSVFLYVLFNIGKEDTVFLYHSVYYDPIVTALKKIKHFRIIYEIEEIYADVRKHGVGREKEISRCEEAADGFIFPTELLNEIVNRNSKKSIIIYGAYQPVSIVRKGINKKTSIVYSGTLMNGKGAQEAVNCASALDDQFEIHIIGYGSIDEKRKIVEMIEDNSSMCMVSYDGMKYGEEYINYMTKCDIGICIQPSDSLFNGSSFPSKILSYFNCGLAVVASEMESLKKSKLAKYIYFSRTVNPEDVATAIRRASMSQVSNIDIILALDEEVSEKIEDIMLS
ncbi:glycosyltransferase [Pseudobutyrivibrio xylanivorans]|uniref:Glycosyltransferase family 4 protein n=1 Tax=Pseudobutyrivibrio xylanivorans TaxID=185007 RepID=A0A5P6VUT1_PSEXY|nr:glycosyltransferase [Pseudobutyrivibrio xylanivorans]QFJ56082.1 glycosyltransferase family 4 protein [Pseudobutyrivibrio xylanivorans]